MNQAHLPAAGKTALLAVPLFFILCTAASGDPGLLLPAALAACLAAALLLLRLRSLSRQGLPLLAAVGLYVLWGLCSTLYAVNRKLAAAEFSKWLIAFAVFLAGLYLLRRAGGYRLLAGSVAWAGAACGLLSVDAASSGFLIKGFRAVMGLVTASYETAGSGFPSRLATIFENANTYAGLMSIAALLSLWLLLTARTPAQRVGACFLTAVNCTCYLLAFSMASLFFFVLACLLLLALAGEKRISLFLIMAEAAAASLLAAGLSMPGLPRHPGGSFLPLTVIPAAAALTCALDLLLRDRLTALLERRRKALVCLLLALVLLTGGYLAAAFHFSDPYRVLPSDTLKRSAQLEPGTYTLTVTADSPAEIQVSYRNEQALITNRDLPLAEGSTQAPCTFTVPEDSEIVFIRVLGDTVVTDASYEGPRSGSLMLRYRFLPSFIASRIQALRAPGTAIQRLGFWEDGMKLFRRSPLVGSGLGSVESQLAGVRSYHYEIRQLHSHFVQMLADGGILGLALYLGLMGSALFVLLSALRRKDPSAPILLACCLQMFGQSLTDVTWSAGHCLPVFFLVLAMAAGLGADPEPLPVRRVPALLAAGVLLLYCVPLSGSVFAQVRLRHDPGLEDLKLCAGLDFFDSNSHRLSYVLSSLGSSDPEVQHRAAVWAGELEEVPSNTIPMALARYYLALGDYPGALRMFDWAEVCSAGDAGVWNDIFRCFHQLLRAPAPPESVLYDLAGHTAHLEEWNRQARLPHTLDPDNALFLTAAARTDPEQPGQLAAVEAGLLLDTAAAPDLDGDGRPDTCTDSRGAVVWEAGKAHAGEQAVLSFAFAPIRAGRYRLEVFCTRPEALTGLSCAGQSFSFTPTESSGIWEIDLDPGAPGSLYGLEIFSDSAEENLISRVVFQAVP